MAGYVIKLITPIGGATGDRVYANRDVARRASRRLNDDLARLGFDAEYYSDFIETTQDAKVDA
jgi:hypothetical protein